MTDHDPVFTEPAGLQRHDVGDATAERIRGAALARFRAAGTPARRGVWTRFLEPVFVVASVLGYLGWTAATFHSLGELRTHETVAASELAPPARLP